TPVAVAFDATRLGGAGTADMEDCIRVTVADAHLVGAAAETAVTVPAAAGRDHDREKNRNQTPAKTQARSQWVSIRGTLPNRSHEHLSQSIAGLPTGLW